MRVRFAVAFTGMAPGSVCELPEPMALELLGRGVVAQVRPSVEDEPKPEPAKKTTAKATKTTAAKKAAPTKKAAAKKTTKKKSLMLLKLVQPYDCKPAGALLDVPAGIASVLIIRGIAEKASAKKQPKKFWMWGRKK